MERDYAPPEGLDPLLAALLLTGHERHVDMVDLVSGLPDAALNWRPSEGVNSLAGLARHIVDVEAHAARVARGDEGEWDASDGAHLDESGSGSELIEAIEACDALVKQVIPALMDLERGRVLVEEFDHASMHYGHMQVTRLLWEQAHPEVPRTYEHWGWHG